MVAHDMHREIARTIRSLSPQMQRGVRRDEYELVVVDNGSSEPIDRAAGEAFGARIRWLRLDDPSPSPAPAINRGIAAASAPLIGAMIDGARLASSGLLRQALRAARLQPRAVIVTVGFHLGHEQQQEAVGHGYDQRAEDTLLAGIDWTGDGYRLFEISTLAQSSAGGWFELPAESNAVFMRRRLWRELGGFDEAFRSPGGGFVNHDLLVRACELPGVDVIQLLGEGTFHQVHGGISTNRPPGYRQDDYQTEYLRVRGRRFAKPQVEPLCFGGAPPAVGGRSAR
jgi:glycosyltransferase involved in cell wall biosynthesis